jgi:hypothetical protein
MSHPQLMVASGKAGVLYLLDRRTWGASGRGRAVATTCWRG